MLIESNGVLVRTTDVLDAYTLVEPLGAGGMAQVHLARVNGRTVALKRLDKTADIETRTMLVDEARLLTRLDHPNVATVFDVGADEMGVPYMAMELIHGKDLYAIMQRAPEDSPAGSATVGIVGLGLYWVVTIAGLLILVRWLPSRGKHSSEGVQDKWSEGPGLSVLAHVGMLVGVVVFTIAYLKPYV